MDDPAERLRTVRSAEFSGLTEPHRRELQVHCYRILGSLEDAEDTVQETMLRAWRRRDSYEGRASFRAWLYKIATNACLDALDKRARRILPQSAFPPADPREPFAPPTTEITWLQPLPDEWLADAAEAPEARFATRENVSLAFLAALQTLPPRQRAVLLLRDVLDWRASEAADCLGLTVSAVNSLLHRARVTLAQHYHGRGRDELTPLSADARTQALLDRYLRAWEAADIGALVGLLKADVVFTMPPTPTWFRGRADVRAILKGMILAPGQSGGWKLKATRANGQPAFAVYQRGAEGAFQPFGIQVLTLDGPRIAEACTFIGPALFPRFGLPLELSV